MDRINMEHSGHSESFIGQCCDTLLGFHIWTASSLKKIIFIKLCFDVLTVACHCGPF